MKKKLYNLLSVIYTAAVLTGCTSATDNITQSGSFETSVQSETFSDSSKEVMNYTDAEIIIPAALAGEELSGMEAVTENASEANTQESLLTYSLSSDEISEIIHNIETEVSDSIQTILNDKEYYPHITSIDVNSSYTEFTITLENGEMNTYESMLVMSYYTMGDKYQIYSGIPLEQVKTIVRYLNGTTGETVNESDSSSMNAG